MKMKMITIILAAVISFPIQSRSVNASEVKIQQDSATEELLETEQLVDALIPEDKEKAVFENDGEVTIGELPDENSESNNYEEIAEEINAEITENEASEEEAVKEFELLKELEQMQEEQLPVEILEEEIQQVNEFEVVNGVLIKYNGSSENVIIPSNLGITTIGTRAFYMSWDIKSVIIPEGVITIQSEAFEYCTRLVSVKLPNSLITIANYAFSYNSNLTDINIPGKVEIIGNSAFSGCDSLTNINIPNSVISIGEDAFYGCDFLKNVTISNRINSIGNYAFAHCAQLTSITIPGSLKSIGSSVFYNCGNLQSIIVSNGVNSLGSNMFGNCKSLTNISLPEGLTIIASSAFEGCTNLTTIVIPSSVSKIESWAFEDCTSLRTIKFLGNAPITGYSLLRNTPTDLKIYYLARKTGFTNPWNDRTAQVYSSNTTKINEFVNRLYQKVLGRKASANEVNYYADYLTAQLTTGANAGRNFVFSPEFINKKLSNSAYIDVLYQTFMGRASDQSGKTYWRNMLDNGVSREYVFKGFVESPEFTNICKSYGISRGNVNLTEPRDQNANLTMFISRCYQKALGRTAEVDGLNYYAQEILQKRVTPLQASQNFIFSPEFKNKNLTNTDYVKVLYRTFMGREFEQSGLTYHLNRMKNGISREEILLGFAYSPEFKGIMSGFGL